MIIIGHRGARGLAPENTLAAIQKALQCSVDEVEIDIRVTKDKVPILNHDRFIVTDKPYKVADHTYEELRKHKTDITSLRQALEAVDGTSILHIEVKHGEPVAPVVKTLASYRATSPKILFVVGSKSQRVLRELHTAMPDVPTIVIEPWSGIRASYRARQVGTKRISMRSWWLWRGFLRHMYKRGYQITPYTLNSPQKAAKWQPFIYGVVTDFPDRYTEPGA